MRIPGLAPVAALGAAFLAFVSGAHGLQSKWIEVASIKRSSNNLAESNLDSVRGRLTATNITIRELIRLAYGVRDYQIEQAPKWADNDRFDLAVKTVSGERGNLEDEKSIVRELLVDRFRLATHREQMPVLLLVQAKGGARLKAHDDAGPKPRGGCGRLAGRRVTADGIATILSRQVERQVLNRTGLSAEYDFQLEFTPDSGPCRAAGESPGAAAAEPSGAPSIYTALQQQVGLKLEPSKGRVDLLLIDRLEKPTQN